MTDPTVPDGTAPSPRKYRRGYLRRLFGVCVAGLAGGVVLSFVIGLFSFAAEVSRYDAPPADLRADAIVALTGGTARIADAIGLLEKGTAQRLLITGVHPGNTSQTLASFAPGRDSLFACCVDLVYAALNTAGNAKETRDWAEGRGYQSLIVVTSSYHLPRSLNELRRELPEAELIPHAVVTGHLDLDAWWTDPVTARLLLSEYVKYLMSLFHLRLGPSTSFEYGFTTAIAND